MVHQYKVKLDLIDIWRYAHPGQKKFTWKQMFYKKMARLDFFLISESLLDIYGDSSIKNSYKSDHAPINLKLIISKHKKGKGAWKLNNSLLLDQNLREKIEDEIELIMCTYACTPYNQEYVRKIFKNIEIEFIIKIDLLWEVLLAQLRYIIMKYAANKKRMQNENETKLKKEIFIMEEKLVQEIDNEIWVKNLEKKKEELEEIRQYKLQGALIRSRWQDNTLGEKPTKFFLNLENKNFISKHIRELKIENNIIHSPMKILEEMRKFYNNLFRKKENIDINKTNLEKIGEKLPKLKDDDKKDLEREITLEELHGIIQKSKNNKSPGPDGFTNEFFKTFWGSLRIILLKLLNLYRKNEILNPAQLEGAITCIPKGGKLRNNLQNWRPITLLNSIYKFFSSIIAYRIKNILPKLIHPDQKGFINGRFIGENTRLIYDIIEGSNKQNLNGLIILIDFQKAFDSISWNFITETLKMFNFGENIINWVRSLQIGSTSKISQNGHFSEKIILERGCRQGDPVSPYLFVLCAEILAEAIRNNSDIKGITLHKQEHKISLYADDTTLFLKANEENIRICMRILKEFELVSGLKVNKEKTKVVKIGGWGDNRIILCKDLKLDWTQEFTALGITYNINNFNNIANLNIELKILDIQKQINLWNARNLTPYGKIIIIKSLLISKITHILLSLPTPNTDVLDKLEVIFKRFLWGDKPPKFRKEILETLPTLGGLKLTNLLIFDASLKISWLKRLVNQELGWAEFPMKYKILDITKYGDIFPKKIIKEIDNKFWKDTVQSVIKLNTLLKYKNIEQICDMPLWHNSQLNLEYRKSWEGEGYHILSDLLNEEGKLLTNNEMNERKLKIHFLDYIKLERTVKKLMNTNGKYEYKYGPHLPKILSEIRFSKKGCSRTYNILMNYNDNVIKEIKEKWERNLNEEIDYNVIENAFKEIPKMNENAYQKYLQFKLLHLRTATNEKLFKMNIKNTNICPLCKSHIESINHVFLECNFVIILWNDIEKWIKKCTKKTVKLTNIEKIFGTQNSDKLIDKIILNAKTIIFNNRKKEKIHNIFDVKRKLYWKLRIEEYQATLDASIEDFAEVWDPIYGELWNTFGGNKLR